MFQNRAVCASSIIGDFAGYQGFWDARIPISYNLRAFQNGLEAVKLAELRQCAIQSGMRIVGIWRFCRLSRVLGRPCTDSVQPEGVSRRFRSGETRRAAAMRYTERYAHCRRSAISPPIKRFGTPSALNFSGDSNPCRSAPFPFPLHPND